MSIPVLVPRRCDDGWRDEVWSYLKGVYWGFQPGFRVIESHHNDGPFNRSAAINQAAAQRYWDDVAVIADADSFVPVSQLLEAVKLARKTGRVVSPFTSVVQLSRECTERMVKTDVFTVRTLHIDHVRVKPIETQSNLLVVPWMIWDRIGGFDERFVGWGGEDNAFWHAAEICRKEVVRVPGAAFHLWHEPASDRDTRMKDPQYLSNLQLANRYMRCRTMPELREVQSA